MPYPEPHLGGRRHHVVHFTIKLLPNHEILCSYLDGRRNHVVHGRDDQHWQVSRIGHGRVNVALHAYGQYKVVRKKTASTKGTAKGMSWKPC